MTQRNQENHGADGFFASKLAPPESHAHKKGHPKAALKTKEREL
ncbi:hypothetical protein [Pseudomonas sp. MPB23]